MTAPWNAKLLSSSEGTGKLSMLLEELGVAGGGRVGSAELKLRGQLVRIAAIAASGPMSLPVGAHAIVLTVAFEGHPAPPPADVTPDGPFVEFLRPRAPLERVFTGDPKFDAGVAIDTNANLDELRQMLSREEVRSALVQLVERTKRVEVTSGFVRCVVPCSDETDLGPPLEALEDLLQVARGGGPKSLAHAPRGRGLEVVMVVASLLTSALFVLTFNKSALLVGFGLLCGVAAGRVMRSLLGDRLGVDSRSEARANFIALLAGYTTGTFLAGFAALIFR